MKSANKSHTKKFFPCDISCYVKQHTLPRSSSDLHTWTLWEATMLMFTGNSGHLMCPALFGKTILLHSFYICICTCVCICICICLCFVYVHTAQASWPHHVPSCSLEGALYSYFLFVSPSLEIDLHIDYILLWLCI